MHQDVRPAETTVPIGIYTNAAPGEHVSTDEFWANARAAGERMRARAHEPYRSQRCSQLAPANEP